MQQDIETVKSKYDEALNAKYKKEQEEMLRLLHLETTLSITK